jgi:hypothetical protein
MVLALFCAGLAWNTELLCCEVTALKPQQCQDWQCAPLQEPETCQQL